MRRSSISPVVAALLLALIVGGATAFFAHYSSRVHEVGGHDTLEWVSRDLGPLLSAGLFRLPIHFPFQVLLRSAFALGEAHGLTRMQSAAGLNLLLTGLTIAALYLAARALDLRRGAGLYAAAAFAGYAATQYFASESDCYVLLGCLAALSLWSAANLLRSGRRGWGLLCLFAVTIGCWTHLLFHAVLAAILIGLFLGSRPSASGRLTRRQAWSWCAASVACAALLLLISSQRLLFELGDYTSRGYGVAFHPLRAAGLTASTVVAPAGMLDAPFQPGLRSWGPAGWSLLLLSLAPAIRGLIVSTRKSQRERPGRLLPALLLAIWFPALAIWSAELHFYALLSVPLALLAAQGLDDLLGRSPRLSAVLSLVVLAALFGHNARQVTLAKSSLAGSPLHPLYQRVCGEPGAALLIVAQQHLAPQRLQYLLNSECGLRAEYLAYAMPDGRIHLSYDRERGLRLAAPRGLLLVQAVDQQQLDPLLQALPFELELAPAGRLFLPRFMNTDFWLYEYSYKR